MLTTYRHDCPFHSFGSEDDSDSILDDSEGEEYGCASQIPGWSWSGPQASKELPLDTPDEPCSELCFKAVPPKLNESDTVEWSKEQMALIDTFASVLRNNPRFSCLLVPAINETCVNIYKRLKAGGLLALVDVPILEEVITSNPAQNTKRKKSFFSKNVKSNRHTTSLPGYPSNTNKTHLHDQRSYVQQCRHSGPCANDSTCKCVRQHVTCEKFCACPVDCPRRWRGCSCKAENLPCSSDKCICIRAGRECDADLCGSCGARELLDPTNRGDESMLTDYRCKNIDLQFGCPVYTIHGHSAVSGMGLFVAKNVAKGGYLGEYVGEILTDAESERRGALYDKNHLSYLFGLNKDRTIDATRQGNKFRFINHSTTRPNCHARIVLANCTHRIGFYSLRALKAGEELFFDYGYGKTESLKFVPHELPPVPSVSKEGNVSKKNKEKGKANSKKSEGKQEKRKAASRTSFRLSNSRTATATNSAYSASDEEEDEVVVLESDDEPLVAMAKRRPLRRRLSATSGGPRPKRMR
ncbi:hypothetical protein FPQ18DRAFT_9166 [Pyronema domesticum]|nr:hypothetical protein FPQ18DRAFT_9166 [Pyronema domesticum]